MRLDASCGLHEQDGAREEAQRADDGGEVGGGEVELVAGRGDDVARHGGDAEEDRAAEVDGRDRAVATAPEAADGDQASQLATRKQMEPKRSGRQIRRSSWLCEIALASARPVLRLKNSVPPNWITPAHQFSRSDRGVPSAWSAAALVKNSEPTKKTAASATAPTRCTKPGNGPTTKQAEPIANSSPIHLVLDTGRLSHAGRGGLSPRSDDDSTAAGAEHRPMSSVVTPPRPAPSPATAPGATADVLVAFGITGDLAKQMTLRSLYRLEKRGLLKCPIVGVAVQDWTDDDLRDRARGAIVDGGETLDPEIFDRFAARLS